MADAALLNAGLAQVALANRIESNRIESKRAWGTTTTDVTVWMEWTTHAGANRSYGDAELDMIDCVGRPNEPCALAADAACFGNEISAAVSSVKRGALHPSADRSARNDVGKTCIALAGTSL